MQPAGFIDTSVRLTPCLFFTGSSNWSALEAADSVDVAVECKEFLASESPDIILM
ncbi:hypothetical protein SNOG_16176 [Parastagonospora nodorum SN15]|uniref:Uncharacterized protein n=1 Tax=Phaeosphaeria nodorum (strain SN15 / ATCC MYA-4574 / FGSC 10173) TaxID=321614 RepID=Q0TW59_PHANO|nr:hypothetical protein SNOG_16176 [Parastagonospora nodorum SN15]EAT76360.1 hypothetical protein SNOG_16176 [Parastagonospora nodorum SN15]